MTIGVLIAKIVLDDQHRAHHGPNDPVSGHVQLRYSPFLGARSEARELFAPSLKLSLVFQGRVKTKVYESSQNRRSTYRGRVHLFRKSLPLYNDRVKIQALEPFDIPLTIFFPPEADPIQHTWEPNRFFENTKRLPPSFQQNYHGFSNHFDCFTEYVLSVQVVVPGIDVNINVSQSMPVTYGYPKIAQAESPVKTSTFLEKWGIQNERLLAPESRPKGFKQRAKFAFRGTYPFCNCDVRIKLPLDLYIGSGIPLEVTVRPSPGDTVEEVPTIFLSSFALTLSGHTGVRAERHVFTEPHAQGTQDNVIQFVGRGKEPFGKGNDWRKMILTAPIKQMPNSFSSHIITRSYSLTCNLALVGAGEQKHVKKTTTVVLHPPLSSPDDDLQPPTTPEAGPSTAVDGAVTGEPSQADGEEELPAYKRPPSYDDAVEDD